MSKRRNPTLHELNVALGSLPLQARFIESEEQPHTVKVYGLCDGDDSTITINEAVAVVETLLHEAFHAVRPNWSEETVDRRSRNFFLRLRSDEVQYLYQRYRRRVRRTHRKRLV